MVRMLIHTLLYLLANAIGLFLAMILLPGFKIDLVAFVAAVVLFTVIEVVVGPLITRISLKSIPSLAGGVALVTTFLGLIACELLLSGMVIGGLANLLAATLLVWLGALAAGLILPMFMFKKMLENR